MENELIKVGITHGDTNGVGYELIYKTFSDPIMASLCIPVIYGTPSIAAAHKRQLGINVNFTTIEDAEHAQPNRLNLIDCGAASDTPVRFGVADPAAGAAALASLERAVADLNAGDIDVLVTAPINKKTIQSETFNFPGHTEYLAERTGEGAEPLMILMNENTRIALATTHLPLSEIASAITPELLSRKIALLHHSLRHDFLISTPRIAVLALNPHAGEDGLLGKEETDIINPAIEASRADGIQCFGPYPADGFFGAAQYKHFDGVLAMYHDQGLAPFKALSMSDGVNYTAGLPVVRTSPDHGTAFDIAGQGKADEQAFRNAVYQAIDIFRNREFDDESLKNPLKILSLERDSKTYQQRANKEEAE